MISDRNCAMDNWAMDELMAKGEGILATLPLLTDNDIVLHGRDGTSIAAFGKQLSDAEIAAVVTYERNAWGNELGNMVQPSEIKALR